MLTFLSSWLQRVKCYDFMKCWSTLSTKNPCSFCIVSIIEFKTKTVAATKNEMHSIIAKYFVVTYSHL